MLRYCHIQSNVEPPGGWRSPYANKFIFFFENADVWMLRFYKSYCVGSHVTFNYKTPLLFFYVMDVCDLTWSCRGGPFTVFLSTCWWRKITSKISGGISLYVLFWNKDHRWGWTWRCVLVFRVLWWMSVCPCYGHVSCLKITVAFKYLSKQSTIVVRQINGLIMHEKTF